MFSESLGFIYEKCKRKKLGFPFFLSLELQNKTKWKNFDTFAGVVKEETRADFNKK